MKEAWLHIIKDDPDTLNDNEGPVFFPSGSLNFHPLFDSTGLIFITSPRLPALRVGKIFRLSREEPCGVEGGLRGEEGCAGDEHLQRVSIMKISANSSSSTTVL